MKVLIPSARRSYTERGETEASGATLAALLADLERQYAGIRFRVIEDADVAADEVVIVQALSGG